MAGLPSELATAPTGRHGLPGDVVAAHQRERILAATIELVAKRGYRGTSVDHVVKAARVGYVAFYALFDDKADCFAAAFERILADAREELAREVSPDLPWPEQICRGLAVLVGRIAADPARARVALVEAQAAGPDAYRRYERAMDLATPKLREGRALRATEAPLADTLEEAVVGGLVWLFHQLLVRGRGEEAELLLGEAVQIALSPYLGEAEARRIAAATAAPAQG